MFNITIENLYNRNTGIKYNFQNQKMSTLTMGFQNSEFSNLSLSNMNESGDYTLVAIILETVNLMGGLVNKNQKV
jgi:hypothetical protein